jgi:DNA-binding SARP family transcriptional activator
VRAADLVKLLALAPGHRLAREQISEALWPTLSPDRGAANVRKAVHHARRTTGTDSAVTTQDGFVELAAEGSVHTDVEHFASSGRAAVAAADRPACRRAATLYSGALLPEDRYAEWCADERERLRLLFLDVLACGEQWGRLVDEDPSNERAHREVMRSQLERGERGAAIRQFERLGAALGRLGLSPDDESTALYEQALALGAREAPTATERARTLLAWGMVHWERADLAEAERAALEVRALAVDAGLGSEFTEASGLLAVIAVAQGRWRELFGQSFADALEHHPDLAPFVFDAHVCMSEYSLHEREGLVGGRRLAARLLELGESSTNRQSRALGLLLDGEVALLAGDISSAQRSLEAADRLLEDGGPQSARTIALERLGQAADADGRHVEAMELHRTALQLAVATPLAQHLVPFVYGGMVAGADGPQAASIVAAAEDEMTRQQVCEPCSMALHVGAVVALASVGDLTGAHRHLAEADRIAGRWPRGPWHGAVAENNARMLRTEGAPPAQVLALLETARAEYHACGRTADEARCEAEIASLR